jgi:hypothetical protein
MEISYLKPMDSHYNEHLTINILNPDKMVSITGPVFEWSRCLVLSKIDLSKNSDGC